MNKLFICRATVAANQNFGENKPVIVIQEDGVTKFKAHRIKINGPCEIIYDKESPIETTEPGNVCCGIETSSEIIKVR